jgi:hypothetical protein
MDEPISIKLNQLFENTQLFLASSNNKKQWQTLYPVICKIAEQFRLLYNENPFSLQAQLALFNPKYDYSTNLVISQCVLTTALCSSQHYNNELSELYISVALVEHLCVCKQLNKLAEHTDFNVNDKKVWQLRHQLAAKIILSAGESAKPIAQILAKLSKYKQALVSTPKIMLYDGGITLVALANIIAMNTTYNAEKKHIDLFKALGDLYIRTPNLFAQQLIKALIAHIGPLLPGSQVLYSEQSMLYLMTNILQRHILISTNEKNKITWYRVKASLNDNPKQWYCTNQKLHLMVWNSEHIKTTNDVSANESLQLLDLISRIKLQHEYSYKGLSQIMAEHPQIIVNLCEAVRPYNKEHQLAKDLKHSLSMVGYLNVPAIIQRVVFERLVNVTPHPLQQFVLKRLTCLVNIMGLIVKHNKNYQFEHIALPLYAYTYYLLTQCSTQLSRKVLISETPNNDLSDPFCVLFGVDGINQEQLSAQLKQLLSDNPWTHALLEAEQIPKKQFNSQHKLWITLKVVAQSVFKPELALTVWQKQILNEQLKLQGWSNQSTFNQQLLALNLSNSI